MDISYLLVWTCLLFFCIVDSADGRVFCYRRVRRRGKCGGLLKRVGYATPQACCRGRGTGFATRKQKVGRNRFMCTPCSELGRENRGTLSKPRSKPRKNDNRRRGRKRRPRVTTPAPPRRTTAPPAIFLPPSTTTTTTTTTPVPPTTFNWPRPQTEAPRQSGYYSFKRSDDDVDKVKWSEWSPCSASCGAGWRSRFKICDDCDKNDYENVMSRPCMINFYCTVDGNWGPWFPWQSCSQSCNGGTRVRQRRCNYPPPAYGGQDCQGNATSIRPCNEELCPVDGGWGEWSDFTSCSATCDQGVKRRVRSCDNPSPANGGRECPGSTILTRKCEMTKCPQHGDWSLWSEWSLCTATCGTGVRTSSRACNSPRPLYGGRDCEGEAVRTRQCASARPCPVDGAWGTWNDFGFCRAARCDWGSRIRTRTCNKPRPQHGGAPCPGNQYESVECFNDQACPRNGSWCAWSAWSECSSTCAEETSLQARQRTCTCPEPRFNGRDCEGDSVDVRDCTNLSRCHTEPSGQSRSKCRGGHLEGSGADQECDQEDVEDENEEDQEEEEEQEDEEDKAVETAVPTPAERERGRQEDEGGRREEGRGGGKEQVTRGRKTRRRRKGQRASRMAAN